jgi:hypothetical protein
VTSRFEADIDSFPAGLFSPAGPVDSVRPATEVVAGSTIGDALSLLRCVKRIAAGNDGCRMLLESAIAQRR